MAARKYSRKYSIDGQKEKELLFECAAGFFGDSLKRTDDCLNLQKTFDRVNRVG